MSTIEDYEAYKRSAGERFMNAFLDNPKHQNDLPAILPEGSFRFPCEIVAETAKAYLLSFDGEEHWIPKGHATLGWSAGAKAGDEPIFAADLTTWIVDKNNLLK